MDHPALDFLIASVFRLSGLFSRTRATRLAVIFGRLWYRLDQRHRKIALENLGRALGKDAQSPEILGLAREVFGHLARILFELGWSLRMTPADFQKQCAVDGLFHVKKAYRKGKGVLLLTGHVGNWELLPMVVAATGHPLNIVYRPMDFAPLDRFFVRFRSRFDARLISKFRAMRKMVKALHKGEMVGILLDQNVDWHEGVFTDFFGRPCWTSHGLAQLALKTGAPVIPGFLIREKFGFRAEFGPEISLLHTGDKRKDLEENTQRFNRIIEAFIRRYPGQWLWIHQRWKTKSQCLLKSSIETR